MNESAYFKILLPTKSTFILEIMNEYLIGQGPDPLLHANLISFTNFYHVVYFLFLASVGTLMPTSMRVILLCII